MVKIVLAIIGGAIGIGLLAYLLFRKTPKRYYAKAKSAHKQGEKCYKSKDFKLSEEYYKDSEGLRKKARDLEKKEGGKNA